MGLIAVVILLVIVGVALELLKTKIPMDSIHTGRHSGHHRVGRSDLDAPSLWRHGSACAEGALMRRLFVLVLAIGLSGCASLKTQIHDRYHDADGHVNVHVVLQDVSYGIEADCAFGQTALARNICLYGRAVIDAALMVPPGPAQQHSVDTMLQTGARDHVDLEPYFDFAMRIFEGLAPKP